MRRANWQPVVLKPEDVVTDQQVRDELDRDWARFMFSERPRGRRIPIVYQGFTPHECYQRPGPTLAEVVERVGPYVALVAAVIALAYLGAAVASALLRSTP